MDFEQLTDADVVKLAQADNADAFDELMRRYKRPVLNFVYRMLGNAADAEDVAQEVFVRVYQNLRTYKPGTKFSTWLFTLANHAAIDRLRWRKRHPTESLDNATETSTSTPATAVNDALAHEIGDHIAAAVAQLPEDQRAVLVLSEYHGQSYAEIAAVMRCSEKSVEARLYRAKQTLRRQLKFLLD